MIQYEYQCTSCTHEVTISQSIKDKPITLCENCGENSLERVISGGICAFVSKEPTTLIQQAERNTKAMGRYGVEERTRIDEEKKKAAKEEIIRRANANGRKIDMPSDKKVPTFTTPELRKKIEKMSPEQQTRYILQGD